jgi:hypothetical protein
MRIRLAQVPWVHDQPDITPRARAPRVANPGPDTAVRSEAGDSARASRRLYPQTGGAWLVFNLRIAVTLLMSNDKGLVAISLHLPGQAAVALFGLYHPPAN